MCEARLFVARAGQFTLCARGRTDKTEVFSFFIRRVCGRSKRITDKFGLFRVLIRSVCGPAGRITDKSAHFRDFIRGEFSSQVQPQ